MPYTGCGMYDDCFEYKNQQTSLCLTFHMTKDTANNTVAFAAIAEFLFKANAIAEVGFSPNVDGSSLFSRVSSIHIERGTNEPISHYRAYRVSDVHCRIKASVLRLPNF